MVCPEKATAANAVVATATVLRDITHEVAKILRINYIYAIIAIKFAEIMETYKICPLNREYATLRVRLAPGVPKFTPDSSLR